MVQKLARAIFLFTLLLAVSPAAARRSSVPPEMDKRLMAGLDAIYRMDFDAGEKEARAAIAMDPEHPHGHFGLAAIVWTRYVYGTESTDTSLVPVFEDAMKTSREKAEAWLKKHPDDPEVLMLLGSCYGLKSRLQMVRKQFLPAFVSGRKAIKFIRKAHEIDSEYYDPYLALGMYDYYTDTYSRLVRVLAKLVLGGSRERGIERLKIAAEKGHYGRYAAKMILVEIYNIDPFGARDPQAAADLMADVRAKYPNSAMLHAAQLVSFYGKGEFEAVVKGAEDYLRSVKIGVYPPLDAAKGNVILATGLWALGEKEEAQKSFLRGSDIRIGDRRSRWSVWALIRAGQVSDIMGRRDEAKRLFQTAAKEPDLWGLRGDAKRYVAKPYKKGDSPGPVQPPEI